MDIYNLNNNFRFTFEFFLHKQNFLKRISFYTSKFTHINIF